MRSMEMSAKTVEAAVEAACEALGVDRDDIHVSYEVLEFPARKLFKTIPAKVLVKVEEPEPEEEPAPPRSSRSLTRPPLLWSRRSWTRWLPRLTMRPRSPSTSRRTHACRLRLTT